MVIFGNLYRCPVCNCCIVGFKSHVEKLHLRNNHITKERYDEITKDIEPFRILLKQLEEIDEIENESS